MGCGRSRASGMISPYFPRVVRAEDSTHLLNGQEQRVPARERNEMSVAAWLKEHPVLVGGIALVSFLALDWLTFSPTVAPLGITPWNPSVGLCFALVIWGGFGYVPLFAAATLITDVLVRQLPFPLWIAALEAVLTGAAYATAVWVLSRPRLRFDAGLTSMRDLLLLTGTAVGGAGAVATAYAGVLHFAGLLSAGDLAPSILRYWVGDVIGILVLSPFLLILAVRRRIAVASPELLLQALSVLAAITVVFGLRGELQLQLFYLLLLPIVWIAVRAGLAGVSAALVLMQISMMMGLHLGSDVTVDVTAFQAIMLVLAFSGLAIGVLISERDRAERRLRLHQDAVARAARQGSMGALATAVAHEINQPLTAIANYARAARMAIDRAPPAVAEARAACDKVVQQIDRTAEVIRRMRELIQLGRMQTEPHGVRRIIEESLDLVRPDLVHAGIDVTVDVQPRLPRVAVDLIHIEQVLINFLRNATDAMMAANTERPRLMIRARRSAPSDVEISVTDNGPGLPAGFRIGATAPITGSESGGLGIGLSLCRTIVEAHGGTLAIASTGNGTRASFTVPVSQGEDT